MRRRPPCAATEGGCPRCLAFGHLGSDHIDPPQPRTAPLDCDSPIQAKCYPKVNMEQPRIQCVLVAAAVCFCASAPAQTVTEDSHPAAVQGKAVHPADHTLLFSPNSAKPEAAQAIEFRALDQMTQKDRELAANAESSIAER